MSHRAVFELRDLDEASLAEEVLDYRTLDPAADAMSEALNRDEDVVRETHERIDARSRRGDLLHLVREPDIDPGAILLRLAVHYRSRHEEGRGRNRSVTLCRCREHSPRGDRTLAWLQALTFAALRDNKLPTLGRLLRAIRKAARKLSAGGSARPGAA